MYSLRDLQARFSRALLHNEPGAIADAIEPDGLDPAVRLGVYRTTVMLSLTDTLAASFPVICRLVDPRFFAFAADAFIRQAPPRAACLDRYGDAFPAFLDAFPACAEYPYLGDVARLEWALHRAARAPYLQPLAPTAMAAFAPDQTADMQIALDPAVAYIESAWPVAEIWTANQPEVLDPPPVDLAAGGVRLEVYRPDAVAEFRPLSQATFAFRRQVAAGAGLEAAVDAVLAAAPEFDLTQAFADLFADRLVVGCRLTASG